MLRAFIICDDQELRGRIHTAIDEVGNIQFTHELDHYPEPMEAARLLRLCRPEVVFLVVDSIPKTLEFMTELHAIARGTPVIAISRLCDPRALSELMRFGVREFLTVPLNRLKLQDTVRRVIETAANRSVDKHADNLYCFLPAKGGAGTSTLACNLSYALSQTPDLNVLLADFDVPSGLSRYLLKLNSNCSLRDLAEHGSYLDEITWEKSIAHAERLHVLHAGKLNPRTNITPVQIRQILTFALPKYDVVCADLSGNLEMYSLELLGNAKEIFVVSTNQAPSIDMAKEKIAFLASLDLGSRVRAIMTITPDAGVPPVARLERHLNAPIVNVVDFTEKRVRESLADGCLVDPKSNLWKQILKMARDMTPCASVRAMPQYRIA